MKRVGVLALQGGYAAHQHRLTELGARAILVRRAAELEGVGGIVLPGGESGAMLRLLDPDLREALIANINSGMPTLATCAGTILLAKHVTSPTQESFGSIDIDVSRNAYGRQRESFTLPEIHWTESGANALRQRGWTNETLDEGLEAVFIRAPKITRIGTDVITLLETRGDPILVQHKSILAATFHPELSERAHVIHALFLSTVDE